MLDCSKILTPTFSLRNSLKASIASFLSRKILLGSGVPFRLPGKEVLELLSSSDQQKIIDSSLVF
jgi:hypothetical protein